MTNDEIGAQSINWLAINGNANKENKNVFELPQYRKTSDMEKFVYGFRKLCEQCDMHNIKYTVYTVCGKKIPIISSFNFDDGSAIGIVSLLEESGFNIEK